MEKGVEKSLKNKIRKCVDYIIHPKKIVLYLLDNGYCSFLPEVTFMKIKYRIRMGKKLNLSNPQTFNEKLSWLKLNNRKDIYTTMVDKYDAKNYVGNVIGTQYIIPTYGVYDSWEKIDFSELPEQFVIKCTHDSGGIVIVKDKENFDIKSAKVKICKCLKRDFYEKTKEWPYKNVKPRIIIEKYMTTSDGSDLKDYKFFVFNGRVKCFKIDFNRFTNHQANYYDRDKNLLKFGEEICPPDYNQKLEFPDNMDQMMKLAEKLSEGIPFLRVDFYSIDGSIFFGENTFYPASGCGKFIPDEWDFVLGSWLSLEDNGD